MTATNATMRPALRHSERMAQLGVLTAGVAHEMNNPAAAVKRGADQLAAALDHYAAASSVLAAAALDESQVESVRLLEQQAGRLESPARSAGAQRPRRGVGAVGGRPVHR